jgi:hypothetical protein
MRVELNDGAWADVRDIAELRNKDRKMVNKSVNFHVDDAGKPIFAGSMEDDMMDALLRRLVTQWSFPMPLPVDDPGTEDKPGSLDKLTLADYDKLSAAVAEHMKLMKGEDSPAKPGTDPTVA